MPINKRLCKPAVNAVCKMLSYIFLYLVAIICATDVKAQSGKIYEEVDGLVAVEAEHYISQRFDEVRQWKLVKKESATSDSIQNILEAASGNAYMQILPDTRVTHQDKLIHGENFSNTPGKMAILDYEVYFNTPGKYYVWARCFSVGAEENGVHVGINGTWPESGQRMQWCQGKKSWRWESSQRTEEVHCGVPGLIYLDVPTSGVHTISFSMREDGFRMDKWLMINYRPTEKGPEEKLYTGNEKAVPLAHNYLYAAITDFNDREAGEVPFYVDRPNNALGINAAKEEYRDKFARATTTFKGEEGIYNITLTTLAEFDGESTYRLLINDSLIGSFQNSPVSQAEDYKQLKVVFSSVELNDNDIIAVESNTHTNKLIPEGDGTAWSRGRWSGIVVEPAHITHANLSKVVKELKGRIAWSADGNQHDTDDWLASPWALAMFRAAGMANQLVYFGYNNHLWDTNKGYDKIQEKNIKDIVALWGGYESSILFDELAETKAAIKKLTRLINESTDDDPLWIVAAGPIETIGRAVEKAKPDALKHVTMLSHSEWNNEHASKHHQSKYSLDYVLSKGIKYKKIQDQNNQEGNPPWTSPGLKRDTTVMSLLKYHPDPSMQKLWTSRVMPEYENPNYQKGYYDYSDAGMAYWLITGADKGGDQDASPQKTVGLLEAYIEENK